MRIANFSAARGAAYALPVHAIPVLRQVEVALQRRHTRSPDHALVNGARQIRQCLTFSSPWWRFSSSASRTSALCSSHPQWQSRVPACSFKLLNLTPILAGQRRALRGAQFIGGPCNGQPPRAFPAKELKFSAERTCKVPVDAAPQENRQHISGLNVDFSRVDWPKAGASQQILGVAQSPHSAPCVARMHQARSR